MQPARAAASPVLAAKRRLGSLDLALVGVVVLAAALRFPTLAAKGYWGDEISTVWLAHDAPGALIRHVAALESTPPLYYLIVSLWAKALGTGEAALRSLSALAGVALVPVTYATARALGARRVALLAALLVACNPLLIWYSQEARAYALVALLSTGALYFFVVARREPSARRCGAWATLSALALATHYFAVFLVVPEAILLLRRTRRARIPAACVAATAAALLPLALHQRTLGHAAWIAGAPLVGRSAAVPVELLVGFDAPHLALAGALALVPALAGLWLARGGGVAGLLAAGAVAAPLALALVGVDYVSARNLIAAAVPFLIVLAIGFGSPRHRHAGPLACAALCAVGVVVTTTTVGRPKYGSEAWRAAARALGPAHGTRVVVAVPGQAGRKPLEYYLHVGELPPGGAVASELALVSLPPQGHVRPLPLPRAPAGFERVSERRSGVFIVMSLRAHSARRLTPRTFGATHARLAPVALLER